MNWDNIEVGHLFEMVEKLDRVYSQQYLSHYYCIRISNDKYCDIEWFNCSDKKWQVSSSLTDGVYSDLAKYFDLVADHGPIPYGMNDEEIQYYRETLR